jgi:regulator of protease activity HflC (stomatin/prohibitin superfamily)
MKNFLFKTFTLILFVSFFTSCAIVQPGEVGVKQSFGKLKGKTISSGMIVYNPFITKVITAPTRTTNLKLELMLPSKEGLSVGSSISILYYINDKNFKQLITKYGIDYEPIVTAVFRSAASDVCAKFFAKDMHSGKRADIEKEILAKMKENLNGSGVEIENVLMKSISLPPGLAKSIEEKLQAEQDAMRMEFILEQEKLEAQRKIIAAKGIRDAQLIQAEGLTSEILKMKSIEAFEKLSNSTNAKVIITKGELPFMIDNK